MYTILALARTQTIHAIQHERVLYKSFQYIGRCGAFPLPVLEHVAKNDVNISRGEHKIHHNISSAYIQHTLQDTYDTNDDWCVLVCIALPRSTFLTRSLTVYVRACESVEQIGHHFRRMFYHFHVLKTALLSIPIAPHTYFGHFGFSS